jgi:FtsH-binding integral membrane protein
MVGLALAAAMVFAMWLFASASSPLYAFTLEHPGIADVLTVLNMPALLLGMVVSENANKPSTAATVIAMFGQWMVLGYLSSWVLSLWSKDDDGAGRHDA